MAGKSPEMNLPSVHSLNFFYQMFQAKRERKAHIKNQSKEVEEKNVQKEK